MSRLIVIKNFHPNTPIPYFWILFSEAHQNLINHTLPSCIPETWPEPRQQIGATCGLYALYIGLMYSMLNSPLSAKIPLPVNESLDIAGKRETTLFSLARQADLTKVGEILNIDSFELLSAKFAISPKKAIHSNPEHFLQDLCKQLDENNTVIVSCDLEKDSIFPGVSNGVQAHWILAFGYFYMGQNLFFLTTHCGYYFLILGADLLRSNNQDPNMLYPRCEAYGAMISTDRNRFMSTFKSYRELEAEQRNADEQNDPRPWRHVTAIPRTNLKQFFCTMFPISTGRQLSQQAITEKKAQHSVGLS